MASRTEAKKNNKIYIIQFVDAPVLCFKGNSQFECTSILGKTLDEPRKKLDINCQKVQRYKQYLQATHETLIKECCGVKKILDYFYVFNGIACRLESDDLFEVLKKHSCVLKIFENRILKQQTSNLVEYLGLNAEYRCEKCKTKNCTHTEKSRKTQSDSYKSCVESLWEQVGGVERAGENVIIGFIDDGINPDHLSFSDRINPKTGQPVSRTDPNGILAYTKPPIGWNGICQTGEGWSRSDCSNKIIGARYYTFGFNGDVGLRRFYGDFVLSSPRSTESHGTACAGIAAGNANTPTDCGDIIKTVCGVAPRARIAVYKAFWARSSFTIDVVAAIEDAIFDGVDVISASFTNSSTDVQLTPESVSFFNAASAGICVIQSAGNTPGLSTSSGNEPFLTSVGATAEYRLTTAKFRTTTKSENHLVFTTPTRYRYSFDKRKIVFAEDIKAEGSSYLAAINLYLGSIDRKKARGKIIVCNNDFLAISVKAQTALDLGCDGLIINIKPETDTSAIGLGFTSKIPIILLTESQVNELRSQLETSSVYGSTKAENPQLCLKSSPMLASFSSQGPINRGFDTFTAPDLLKVDICAPGVNIYTATEPRSLIEFTQRSNFEFFSGSSASCPIVAGINALLRQKHSAWSPGLIKSALMTTATDLIDLSPLVEYASFGQGSGFVNPNRASDPGLVFSVGEAEWVGYYCESNQTNPANCAEFESIGVPTTTRNYNNPAIFLRSFIPNSQSESIPRVGAETIFRKLTNVYHKTCSYQVFIKTDGGVDVSVEPSSFTINPQQTQELRIVVRPTLNFRPARSSLDTQNSVNTNEIYNYGEIVWRDEYNHKVRIPLVVGFTDLDVQTRVQVPAEGNLVVPLLISKSFQFFDARFQGLFPSRVLEGELIGFNFGNFSNLDGASQIFDLNIDETTIYLRIQIFRDEVSNPNAQILMDLRNSSFTSVADSLDQDVIILSRDIIINEEMPNNARIQYNNPYRFVVNSFFNDQPTLQYKVHIWQIKDEDLNNMRLLPPIPTNEILTNQTLELEIDPLDPTKRYLGRISYPVNTPSSEKLFDSTLISNW